MISTIHGTATTRGTITVAAEDEDDAYDRADAQLRFDERWTRGDAALYLDV
jgi:hypothetical protein